MSTGELIVTIVGTLAWPACIVTVLLIIRREMKKRDG